MTRIVNAVLSIAILALLGCGSKGPGETARAFAEAMNRGEINDAKDLCTPQVAGLIDMWVAMGAISVNPEASYAVTHEQVTGDLAEVMLKEAKGTKESKMKLMKVEGTWKVNAPK